MTTPTPRSGGPDVFAWSALMLLSATLVFFVTDLRSSALITATAGLVCFVVSRARARTRRAAAADAAEAEAHETHETHETTGRDTSAPGSADRETP